MSTVSRRAAVGALAGALLGCDTVSADADADAPAPPASLYEGFVSEALSIGADWYDYDDATHVLSPKAERYVVRWGDDAWRIRIVSYYDERGESGFFTLALSTWRDGWTAERELAVAESVKETTVCVDLDAASAVPCDAAHHLVLRSDRRAVPAAGFAVAEPGLYVAAHRARTTGAAVWRVAADAPPFDPFGPVDPLGGTTDRDPVPSVFIDPDEAVLGARVDALSGTSVMQATADFRLCAWTIGDVLADDLAVEVSLDVRCVPLAATAADQRSPDSVEPVRARFSVPADAAFTAAYLAFDQTSGVLVLDADVEPRVGRWPDNTTFDLVLERHGDDVVLIAGPGALVHGVPAGSGALTVPASLWQ